MAEIIVGKLLPNLKVTLGDDETPVENLNEKNDKPAKQSDCPEDQQDVEIVRSWMHSLQNPKVYKNKSGAFSTGLDLISEINSEILDKRAERFGIEKEESFTENINAMYESMGVDIKSKNLAKMKNIRLDALHMRGVNELSTNEIFQYFRDYGPASVEWINDFSCNVLWMDETSCARALLGMSKPLKDSKSCSQEEWIHSDSNEQSQSSPNPDDEPPVEVVDKIATSSVLQGEVSMDTEAHSNVKSCTDESATLLDIPVPPGHWRLGMPHPKANTILLRFATKDDRKLPGAEKRSLYYKKYGNPNYGGLKGLISSSRKRKLQAASTRCAIESGSNNTRASQLDMDTLSTDDDSLHKPNNSKIPRMRMYADDEELKNRNIWSGDRSSEHVSVHSRLGTKYTKEDLCHLGSYHREEEKKLFHKEDYRHKKYIFSDKTSSWRKGATHNQNDLRSKLRKLTTSSASKHRSPLCIEDEISSDS